MHFEIQPYRQSATEKSQLLAQEVDGSSGRDKVRLTKEDLKFYDSIQDQIKWLVSIWNTTLG